MGSFWVRLFALALHEEVGDQPEDEKKHGEKLVDKTNTNVHSKQCEIAHINPLRTQHTWICVKPHICLLAEMDAFPTMQTCLHTVKW